LRKESEKLKSEINYWISNFTAKENEMKNLLKNEKGNLDLEITSLISKLSVSQAENDEKSKEIIELKIQTEQLKNLKKISEIASNEFKLNLTSKENKLSDMRRDNELLIASNMNLNQSLDDYKKNLTSTIDQLNTIEQSCGNKLHFIYFIALGIFSILIVVANVIYTRYQVRKTFVKQIFSQEVCMDHLDHLETLNDA